MNTLSSPLALSARLVGVLVLGAALGGCTTSSQFSVEARRPVGAHTPGQSYRLVAGASWQSPATARLPADAVLRDVATALSARGMYLASPHVVPDLEIDVDLALGAPLSKTLIQTVPVYAQPAPRASSSPRVGGEANSGVTASPRTIGEQQIARTVEMHPKRLLLTAWPLQPDGARGRQPVWSVEVNNADESDDLAAYARLMVAAAMDWIGRATDEPAVVDLHARDSRVTFIARGLSPSSGNVARADPNPAAAGQRAGG